MEGLQLHPTTDDDGRLRISIVGEFDLSGVEHFREVVTPAIGSGEYSEIEFDLGQLTFIDSSGLHALAEADRAMRGGGGQVRIVGVAAPLLKVFKLIGLDRVLTILTPSPAASAVAQGVH